MIPAPILTSLKARYSDTKRHYHTWAHIEALLRHFESAKPRLHRPVPVLWALYYHDAIYDPQAKDNEDQSARWLECEAPDHLSADDIAFGAIIIRATTRHEIPGGLNTHDTADLAAFLDMDLSILAAREADFDQYELDVRAEYAFVPDDAFRKGRGAILTAFLARPRLYFTDEAHRDWEDAARANLARSIAALMGGT